MKKIIAIFLFTLFAFNANATDYYIAASGGSDSNNGSSGSPWATISHALSVLTSGDVLHFQSGTFNTPDAPYSVGVGISFEGVDSASSVITSSYSSGYTFQFASSSEGTNGNQHVSNLGFDGNNETAYGALYFNKRSNVSVHNCNFQDFLITGVAIYGNGTVSPSSTWASGCTFYNNRVENCSGWSGEGKGGLRVGGTTGFLCHDNYMTQLGRPDGENGYVIKAVEGYNIGLKIYNNTLIRQKAVYTSPSSFDFAIELWYVSGETEIYNNQITGSIDATRVAAKGAYNYSLYIHDNTIGETSLNTYEGVRGILLEGYVNDVIITRNHIHHVCSGIYFSQEQTAVKVNNVSIYYNILEHIGSQTASKGWGIHWTNEGTYEHDATNVNIWNNVIIGDNSSASNMWGIGLPSQGASSNISVRNNIVQGFDYAAVYAWGDGGVNITIDQLSIENNDFYSNGYSNVPRYNNITPTNNTTQNNITTIPGFESASDFHLQTGSGNIDAGISVGLTTDYELNTVPYNATPDIGAYEWQGNNDYYIATAANGGSNSNDGSSGSPWLTLTYACANATTAGNVIHVGVGTFTESAQCVLAPGVSIIGQGATSIIKSAYAGSGTNSLLDISSSAGTPIDGNQSVSYLKFDGDNLTGNSAIYCAYRNNVEISHCDFVNFHIRGMTFYTSTSYTACDGNSVHDCTITNCAGFTDNTYGQIFLNQQSNFHLYNNAFDQTARTAGDNGTCVVSTILTGFKMYNNTFVRNDTEAGAWNFFCELWDNSGGNEIYDNTFHGAAVLDIGGHYTTKGSYSYSIKIYDNYFYSDTQIANQSHPVQAITLESWNYLEDVYVYRNHIKNFGYGIVVTIGATGSNEHLDNINIYYNILENIGFTDYSSSYAIGYSWQKTLTYINGFNIYNNVMTGTAYCGIRYDICATNTNVNVKNNIISGFTTYAVTYRDKGSGSLSGAMTNNDFYNSSTIYYEAGVTHSGFSESSNITTDPLFTSSTDFHLQSGSGCIDAGTDVGLTTDYAGNAVPYNSIPDIGAYEYGSGVPPASISYRNVSGTGGRFISIGGVFIKLSP